MIVVLDNGKSHDDRDVEFIDIGSADESLVVPILLRYFDADAFVLATAEKLHWKSSGSALPSLQGKKSLRLTTDIVMRRR